MNAQEQIRGMEELLRQAEEDLDSAAREYALALERRKEAERAAEKMEELYRKLKEEVVSIQGLISFVKEREKEKKIAMYLDEKGLQNGA